MNFRHVAATALGLSLIAGAGQAQMMGAGSDTTPSGTYGPYLRAEGGWNHMNNLNAEGPNSALAGSTKEDEGYIAGGAIGYGFGMFRAEVNIDYRGNSIDSVHISNGPLAGVGGSAAGTVQGTSMMANGLMDLPYSWMGLKPYIGAGAGAVYLKLNSMSQAGTTLVDNGTAVFALQGMAGVRYDLTPQWGLGLEYRFLNGFHPEFQVRGGGNFNTNDYRNHSILLSVTYKFGAPPAPMRASTTAAAAQAPGPQPAPAPAPVAGARQLFLVYFDFDKATITAAGQQVLDAAADAINHDRAVRIELTGYTDTVGTKQYNLNLSRKRAEAVRDYLSRKGIPQNRMDVAWKGEEDLRVPTPNGVREPQNRRVEIVMP